jgi:hypothetical protein
MRSLHQVVLTQTAVVVLSKGAFLTSIPLRHWTTSDGSTWSSRLRRAHEIDWLITRLTDALQNLGSDSVIKRIMSVMSEELPSPLPIRALNIDSHEDKTVTRTARVPAKRAHASSLYAACRGRRFSIAPGQRSNTHRAPAPE